MEKKKLDDFTKAKLIYSIELGVFSILFTVLGFLKLFNKYNLSRSASWYVYVFIIITMIGGTWFIVDLIWTTLSKKRRAKQSLIDKILLIPSSLGTYIFDIRALIVGIEEIRQPIYAFNNTLLNIYTGSLFLYFALVYIFQAIYHFKYPIPMLINEYNKAKEEEESENNKEKEDKDNT